MKELKFKTFQSIKRRSLLFIDILFRTILTFCAHKKKQLFILSL